MMAIIVLVAVGLVMGHAIFAVKQEKRDQQEDDGCCGCCKKGKKEL